MKNYMTEEWFRELMLNGPRDIDDMKAIRDMDEFDMAIPSMWIYRLVEYLRTQAIYRTLGLGDNMLLEAECRETDKIPLARLDPYENRACKKK